MGKASFNDVGQFRLLRQAAVMITLEPAPFVILRHAPTFARLWKDASEFVESQGAYLSETRIF